MNPSELVSDVNSVILTHFVAVAFLFLLMAALCGYIYFPTWQRKRKEARLKREEQEFEKKALQEIYKIHFEPFELISDLGRN